MGAGVNGKPIGFNQQQHEKGGHQEQVGGAPIDRRLRHQQVIHHERQHRLGEQGDTDEHQDERRFGEDGDHDRPARADAAISTGGIQAGQRDHERGKRQDQPAAENVAHVRQRQRKIRQHGNQERHRQHRREGDDRRRPEQPGRRLWNQNLLVEQFPQIPVWLEDARPLSALNTLLELQDDALQQWGQQHRDADLGNLEQDVASHRVVPVRARLPGRFARPEPVTGSAAWVSMYSSHHPNRIEPDRIEEESSALRAVKGGLHRRRFRH